MIPLVNPERVVQNRVINLLHEHCGYQYLGSKQDTDNSPIIGELLCKFLTTTQHATTAQAEKVVRLLETEVRRCHDKDSLYETNLTIYKYLRYGVNIQKEDGSSTVTFWLIDWNTVARNNFYVAEEVTVRRNIEEYHTRRPDVVIYVNGIALGVIELKKASVSVKDGIGQQIRNNSRDNEICHFFATAQYLLAGNESEGVYYGTILTPEKFWQRWKEPTGQSYPSGNDESDDIPELYSRVVYPNELDRSLLQMLDPQRLLTLVHDMVVFDGGVKKVCRPNQFFAFEAAKPRIHRKQSGIIWHSQGAGKSLMMVMLAQWIFENAGNDPRVVIITDRDELDLQITNGFKDVGENPARASSGKQLLRLLENSDSAHPNAKIICTLIHKFGLAGKEDTTVSSSDRRLTGKRSPEQYMDDLAARLPAGFRAKGNIFVFVDECHRTQSGILNRAMKKIMGDNVMLIGFTGTPLLRAQKSKINSRENFGPYIHTYKFNEAVEDNVVLDLRYEAREVEQEVSDPETVDQLFEKLCHGLKPKAKEELQGRWSNMKNLFSSRDRVRRIVANIIKDMHLVPCLREGWGNAMLVCDSIYQAFRYWVEFQNTDLKDHCAVVSSFDGKDAELNEGYSDETQSEAEFKAEKAKLMFGNKTPEEFTEWAKTEFINHPQKMKLLIVVSKLLTGFDAPSATYLYLDKKMEGQDLFQAICRVNRKNDRESDESEDGEVSTVIGEKNYGYIVDFKQLFRNIEHAISDYTQGAFSGFDTEDVEGLLNNRFEDGRRDLDAALERCERLCEPVAEPKSINEFFDYFVFNQKETPADQQEAETIKSTPRREAFYAAVTKLVRCYTAIALDMDKAGYTEEEAKDIFERVKNFDQIRVAIEKRAGDVIDMKRYDQEMRALLDDYVEAHSAKLLASLDDFSFLELVLSDEGEEEEKAAEEVLGGKDGVASTIAANVRRVINRKRESNPEEYEKLSEKLNRLLDEYRQGTLEYKEYLNQVAVLARELSHRTIDERLNTQGRVALYDNLGQDIELALKVDAFVRANAALGFRENEVKKGKLRKALTQLANKNHFDVDKVMRIVINNHEY